MYQGPDPITPKALLAGWLAAVTAIPLALITAAAGQGLGTLVAGGRWIGVCVPWDRQAWALVNQPALNFASLPSASGYWLGSLLLPLLVAAASIPLSLRVRNLAGQLLVIQTSWTMLVVASAWQPLTDPALSHLTRWLAFRGLSAELRWIAVAAAAVVSVPVVLRLVAIGRITRFHISRRRRLALVLVQLFPAPVAWAGLTILLRDAVPVQACVAAGVLLLTGLTVAWYGYPPPLTHAVRPPEPRSLIRLAVALAVTWAVFVPAGRPLPDDRASALQWARTGSFNNIRDWMAPWQAPWVGTPRSTARGSAVPG